MLKRVFWLFLSIGCFLSTQGLTKSSPTTLYFKNSMIETKEASAFINAWSSNIPKGALATIRPGLQSSYYIVQFDQKVSSADFRKSVEKIAKIKRYVPHNAFIVQLKGTELDLAQVKNLQWYAPYSAYLKVEKSLLNKTKDEEINVGIYLFSKEEQTKIRKELLKFPILIEDLSPNFIQIKTMSSALSKIASIEGIEWIEKVKEAKVNDVIQKPRSAHLSLNNISFSHFNGHASGAKALNPDKLYQMGIKGGTEKIAIADTGLDKGSLDSLPKDLEGRVERGYAVGRLDTGRWDDPNGHGTHVAGLVAGNGAQSQGEVRGVAYEARLIMQSLFKWATREGKIEKAIVVPGNVGVLLNKAYQDGARVHTNSWQYASTSGDYDLPSVFLDKFIWEYPDLVVIFAAGNSGVDLDKDGFIDQASISVPSSAKNCISVGASENLILKGGIQAPWKILGQFSPEESIWGTDPIANDLPSNNLRGMAAFSSRGPTSDGRIKPDLVAPGTNNLSLKSRVEEVSDEDSWAQYNEDYVFMGGTSMSAPLVAGAAALVREYYKTIEKRSFISSALVKATLINGATDLYPGQFTKVKEIPTQRPNVHEGFGRVNLEDSLIPSVTRLRRSIDDTSGVGEKEERVFKIKVINEQEPLRITLVYNDYPGSPAVQKALVNNLDLIVTQEERDETAYFPNGRRSPDDINNVENVDILEPQKGTYTIRIVGKSVPFGLEETGKQPFALVISGGFEL